MSPPIDDISFVAGEKLVEKRWREVNRFDAVAVLSFWGIVLVSFMNLVTLSHTERRKANRQVTTPIDTEFGCEWNMDRFVFIFGMSDDFVSIDSIAIWSWAFVQISGLEVNVWDGLDSFWKIAHSFPFEN